MTKESDPDRIIQSSYDRIVYKEKLEIDAKFNEFRNIVNQVSKNAGQYKTNTPNSKYESWNRKRYKQS